MVDEMQSQLEADPHEAYLDAVFARIDRMRHIDASILTQRYGIDPAALSPVGGEGEASWAVNRVLSDADSQREELREHLDGLTQEFVAAGMAFEAAAIKAQETLGDSGVLAKQISRSTAQSALAVDSRWMPWVRSILPNNWIFIGIYVLSLGSYFVPIVAVPLLVMTAIVISSVTIGFVQGYSLGQTVTGDTRTLIDTTAQWIETIRKLPIVPNLTLRQRRYRFNLWYVSAQLKQILRWSKPDLENGKIVSDDVIVDVGAFMMLCAPHAKYAACLACGYTARKYGFRMAVRSRLAKSQQSS